MQRRRSTAVPAVAALALTLTACGDAPASPAEPAAPALAVFPGEPDLPELPAFCPEDTYERTPEEVLDHHRAALAAGNLDAVFCNYATGAVVIADGGIDEGQDEIRSSLDFFLQVFGGTQPVVVQQISVEAANDRRQFPPAHVFRDETPTHMVRLLFTVDTPCVIVPDGIDTYFIRRGQIHAQTSHAFPVFQDACLP